MAGIGGIFAGLGQAVQGYNQADAQALERRKTLQALSIQEMQYQQAKQQQQRQEQAAAANFGALTTIPGAGALPGAQPIPQAAGPASAAPQPQGPQPPMPGQSSMPAMGGAQRVQRPVGPPPVGAAPGGTGVPSGAPPGPPPGASPASLPGGGAPGAEMGGQPQLSQPADMLRQMAMQIKQANPGIDPMTAMEAIKQRIDLMKGLEPDLKNQITLIADQMKNSVEIQKLTQDANNAIMRANTAEEIARIRGDFATQVAQIGAASREAIQEDKDKAKGPGGTGVGSRESAQMNRIISAGNEAVGDLQNVMRLPIGTTRGWVGPRADSLAGITRDALVNEVTPQATQSYNVRAAGLQRSMAAIEAAGLMPSGTLTHQMDAVVINPGDSYQTALEKMAQARQIAERGLEPLLDNPRLADQQKAGINKIMADLKKAVPFTIEDIDRLSTSNNPKATLGSYAKGEGLGGGDIPQEAIDALKSGQGTAEQFDQIFGAGAAKKALGQ